MSHDVSLWPPADAPSSVEVGRVEALLRTLGFEQTAPSVWRLPQPYIEAYLGHNESADGNGKRLQLDTHTPWEVIRTAEQGHAVRWVRLAIARELGWTHDDNQNDQRVRPIAGWRFGSAIGGDGAKNTLAMQQYTRRREESTRPKGRIVVKDGQYGYCKHIVPTPQGGWLCGMSPPTIDRSLGLQLRDQAFATEFQTSGIGGHLALHPKRPWLLASGPLVHGYEGEVCWFDLESRRVRVRFPLRAPFAWETDTTFVAATPSISVGSWDGAFAKGDPLVSADLLSDRWKTIFANPQRRLLRVDVEQDAITEIHDQQPLKDAYGAGPEHMALSPDGQSIFVAMYNDLCALDASTGTIRWRHTLGRGIGDDNHHSIRAIAVSACGRWIASVGGETNSASSDACVVLDASTGTIVLALAFKEFWRSTPNFVTWHPNGWFAVGTDAGAVAFIDLAGTVRTFKAAPKGVRALAFSRDARCLVVGGVGKELRAFDLLPDE